MWVLCDQLRAHELSHRGGVNARTPNLDDLAGSGQNFLGACAGAPWCCPFRGALLTGLYPHQNGVTRTPPGRPLDPAIPTVAHAFNDAGYHTAWVGKWHLDGSNHRTHRVPPERRGGFAHWLGYENNNNQHESYVHGVGCETPQRLQGYEPDALADLFAGHLRDHVNGRPNDYQPFFACLSVQPPHDPYWGPINPPYASSVPGPDKIALRPNVPRGAALQEQARRDAYGYARMVENIDWNVGRLRLALRELGIDRETWIVFMSDHGDMLGSHGQRGKSSPWEESIRIPFIVARVGGPYAMKVGENDAPLNHVDIAPTSLGLCGIRPPGAMAGFDYSGLCRRQADPPQAPPESAFLQQIEYKRHARTVNRTWRGVVTRDGWKYACMSGHDWLLHCLPEDPYEQDNRAYNSHYAAQRERCHRLLRDWIRRTGDAFELPPLDFERPSP